MSFFIQLIKIAIHSENSLNSICLKTFLHHIRFLQIKNCEFNSFKVKKTKMRVFQSKIILSNKKSTIFSHAKISGFSLPIRCQSHNDTLIISIGQKKPVANQGHEKCIISDNLTLRLSIKTLFVYLVHNVTPFYI